MRFLDIEVVLPILGGLDGGESVFCRVHPVRDCVEGAENVVRLPCRGTIIEGKGGSGKTELVDGKDVDEMSEKRMSVWFHVKLQ